MVGPEAMEKFCEDIGVEPENVSLSWIYLTASFSALLPFISTATERLWPFLQSKKTFWREYTVFCLHPQMSFKQTHFLSFLQIIMLVIAWHLEAANMGFFTKDEWLRGMTLLQ